MRLSSRVNRRMFLAAGVSALALGAAKTGFSAGALHAADLKLQYDFVIVGAGPGGGPLAAELAAAGHTVALLDAGLDPLSQEAADLNAATRRVYETPGFFGGAAEHPVMSWDFFVDHYDDQEQMARNGKYVPGQGVLYPRGIGPGGSASHNALIFTYPHDRDFDDIVALTGDESWASDRMRAYYTRLEACDYCHDTGPERGKDGYLPVAYNDKTAYDLFPAIRDIAHAGADTELGGDMNGHEVAAGATGSFYMPQNVRGQKRVAIRELLIETQRKYPGKLDIIQNALVSKVITTERDGMLYASGVEFYKGGGFSYRASKLSDGAAGGDLTFVSARNEVIVAAGAFNTPQILKLSGIGPRQELDDHGIDVVADLPGVGANLQDRYEAPLIYELKEDIGFWDRCTPFVEADPCQRALETGAWDGSESPYHGPYAGNSIFAARVFQTAYSDGLPDVVTAGVPFYFKGYYPGFSAEPITPHWTWNVLKIHTKNRSGEVLLRSSDPRDTPHVKFRFFQEGETDLKAGVEGLRRMRALMQDPKAQQHIVREVLPGADVTSDEELGQYVRDIAWGHHASCTAAIGADTDPNAVLDSRFKVRGFQNLRVVDACVFPTTPGFFPTAAILMISHKAADVILEDTNAT